MSKSLPVPSSAALERSEECPGENNLGKPYEPPRIERLGNLRELLAKSGAAPRCFRLPNPSHTTALPTGRASVMARGIRRLIHARIA